MINTCKACSDQELLALLKQHDKAAFTEIYRRHWRHLYKAAYNVLRDSDSSKDILQEVFLWFWNQRDHLKIVSIEAYLYVAVKYKVANYIRSNKVKQAFFDKSTGLDIHWPSSSDTSLEVKELKDFISAAMHNLPEKCGEVFRLSRNEQLSYKEIANQLNLSEKTVEHHISVAIKKLKKNLTDFYFGTLHLR